MEKSDIVIIGGVACGCKTAAVLARRKPELKITLFQKEQNLSYGTCGLPYFASGDIDNFQQLTETPYKLVRDVEFFQNSKGFTALTEHEVMEIDRDNKAVKVKDLKSGEIFEHGYDKLVIATGASPSKLPIDLPEHAGISYFTRPEDAIEFRKSAQTGQIGSAVIIGGGFIGCELAEAVGGLWGIETTLVEMEEHLLPYVLDYEMAIPVEKEMEKQGVNLFLRTKVVSVDTEGKQLIVKLSNDEIINADRVFICGGVTPNSKLAQIAGLKLGEFSGILVNEYNQTSDPDIYAGGDVVEVINQITGKNMYMPMGSIANRHGRIIADHISGGDEKFPGVMGAFLVKVFDINIGTVGLSEDKALSEGIETVSVWGTFVDKPDYYPESKSFSVKMIVNKKDDTLIGLQAVGLGDVARRVDVFSAFLQKKSSVDDLLDFEQGYAPPYSEALDPMHHLAAIVKSVQNGFKQENPGEDYSAGDFFLLDIREPDEIEPLPFKAKNIIRIPSNQLRDNLDKLNKNSQIIILCHRGIRSYQAMHTLREAGFDKISYIAGGTTLSLKSLA